MSESEKKKKMNPLIITRLVIGSILMVLIAAVPDYLYEYLINAVVSGEMSITQYIMWSKILGGCIGITTYFIINVIGILKPEDINNAITKGKDIADNFTTSINKSSENPMLKEATSAFIQGAISTNPELKLEDKTVLVQNNGKLFYKKESQVNIIAGDKIIPVNPLV